MSLLVDRGLALNAFRLILAFPLPAGAVRESRFFGGRPAQKTSLHPTVKINK
jgi:hypothetical protein